MRVALLFVVTLTLPAAAIGIVSADGGSCTLAVRLAPGQVVAYDGTYQLQVPSAKNGKNLVLAWVGYGLVLRVEEIDDQGAVLSAAYDRFEHKTRREPGTGWAGWMRGQTFRFRLTPNGRIQDAPGGTWSPDLGVFAEFWPGWPEGPVGVGGSWRAESRLGMASGGSLTAGREYRLRELGGQGDRAMALMDYIERGTVTTPAEAAGQKGRLEGTILGVGQVRFDLSLGVIERASSVSIFEGTWRADEAPSVPASRIRLEIESTVVLRREPAGTGQLPSAANK